MTRGAEADRGPDRGPGSGANRRPTRRMAAVTPPGAYPAPSGSDLAPVPGPRERYPWDLATAVAPRLATLSTRAPGVEQLGLLFEAMYFASLRTEEGRPVTCTLCWLDPDGPLPSVPGAPRPRIQRTARAAPADDGPGRALAPCDGWSVVRFAQPIPLSIATLIKLSAAADPACAALAAYPDAGGRTVVWGLIDQVEREGARAGARPGLFEATLDAPAHLVVTAGGRPVASLIHGQLTRRFHDVFRQGPIERTLAPFLDRFAGRVRAAVGREAFEAGDGLEAGLRGLWLGTLGRILTAVQAYRHGGALLLAPRLDAAGLQVKYGLRYARLEHALVRLAATRVARAHARDRMWRGYLLEAEDGQDVPAELHIEERKSSSAEAQCVSEVAGCVRFVASLTRVDGLVALDGDLAVHGFGAEITAQGEPGRVLVAHDALARNVEAIDPTHFGTRHRSMMRYCALQPGSVGLVVSQDGAIRVMTSVGDRLLLWEQVELVEAEDAPAPPPA